MKYLFGFAGVVLILAAITFGSDLTEFINIPSVIIVVGLTICVPLAHHSINEVTGALGAALCSSDIDPNDGQHHVSVLSTIRMAAVGSGVVGFLIGLIQMLIHMENPRTIGPAMAVALLTVFYGVLISELIVGPLINRVRRQTTGSSASEGTPAGPSVAINTTAVLGGLLSMFVLLVAFFPSAG